jgi:predicted Zn-dependent protease
MKTLKNIFYIFALIVIATLLYMLFNSKTFEDRGLKQTHKALEVENTKDIAHKTKEQKIIYKKTTSDVKYDLSLDDEYENTSEKAKPVQKSSSQPKAQAKTQNSSFSISTKNINSIKNLLEAYKKNHTYSLAVKISEFYYKDKKFTKSLSWSKKANRLNSKDEQSWILYASSEYALGNKKNAKKVLSLYLRNTASPKANKLLKSWKEEE